MTGAASSNLLTMAQSASETSRATRQQGDLLPLHMPEAVRGIDPSLTSSAGSARNPHGVGFRSQDQEDLQTCISELCTVLNGQITLTRRCLGVHDGLPSGFLQALEEVTRRLQASVEDSRAELMAAAAGNQGLLQQASGTTTAATMHGPFRTSGTSSVDDSMLMEDSATIKSGAIKLAGRRKRAASTKAVSSVCNERTGLGFNSRRISLTEQLDVEKAAEQDEEGRLGKIVDGVMNPNWPGRLGWDMGVILLVVIDAMVLPFQFAYKDGSPPDGFDTIWTVITTTFFTVDICLSFMTAYTAGRKEPGVAPGRLVTDKRRIASNYMRTWFCIDFASTIPWGGLANMLSGGEGSHQTAQMATLTKIVKFVRLLRLMRMLRLAKLMMIWEKVEAHMGSVILKQSLALVRVVLVLVGICHWNACIWWIIGQPSSLLTEFFSPEAQEAFREMRHWTTVVRGPPGAEWTWLSRRQSEQYTFCFYWTLGVMRTMPSEVTPENQPERVYVMVFMFFAFSAFAICVALITQTFFKFSERKRAFDDDLAQVRMYMRNLKDGGASVNLQASVKAFLRHLYDARKTHAKENSMLQNLPPQLLSQLKFERLQSSLVQLDILQDLPAKATYYVSDMCEVRDVPSGTFLCRRGRTAEACWIVLSGRLHISGVPCVPEGPCNIVDQDCLREALPTVSRYSVSALVASELIRIDKARFVQTMSTHEEFKHFLGFLDDVEPGVDYEDTEDYIHRSEMETVAATAAIMS